VLAPAGIRVLPIARQTNKVGGSRAEGVADGLANGSDVIETFGEDYLEAQGAKFFVFLDVEGSGVSHLSSDYYTGWVAGLSQASQRVTFLPGIYGLPDDEVTWQALSGALANGVACGGLWMARWLTKAPEPVAWDTDSTSPNPDPGVPVLLWQYMDSRDGANLDRNLVNPAIDAQEQLLRLLIVPPSSAENEKTR
jgi:hypothetical protein